ncbi:uncharacterized protein LOC116801126 [Drosophila sechellia]|uniref:uncharacterized protein LOC116801126 n=1 Tax=Drosophila sechellia TaxID=7238 RepID=UPI0013DE3D49|nr:uncharacterized protein LOC116801126 [Drosophila sechellia]
MAIFGTYFALMIAAWGMQLCPRLYFTMGENALKFEISSISSAFIEANLYTLFTILILQLPSKIFENRRQWNFKWVFVMPYIMHYVSCFWSSTQNIRDLLIKPPMYMIKNYGYLHLGMTLICGLQLLAMVEIVFILFYSLKKGTDCEPKDRDRQDAKKNPGAVRWKTKAPSTSTTPFNN